MATVIRKDSEPKKGSIEEASNVMKQSRKKDKGNTVELPAKPPIEESKDPKVTLPEENAGDENDNKTPYPVPNAEQIEQSAQMLAGNADLLEAFRQTLGRAEEIVGERDAPAKMTAEDMKAANHARIVATYGKDFVTAMKGTNKGYYSRKAWNQMGAKKMGWVEVSPVMPEVAQAATDAAAKPTV